MMVVVPLSLFLAVAVAQLSLAGGFAACCRTRRNATCTTYSGAVHGFLDLLLVQFETTFVHTIKGTVLQMVRRDVTNSRPLNPLPVHSPPFISQLSTTTGWLESESCLAPTNCSMTC